MVSLRTENSRRDWKFLHVSQEKSSRNNITAIFHDKEENCVFCSKKIKEIILKGKKFLPLEDTKAWTKWSLLQFMYICQHLEYKTNSHIFLCQSSMSWASSSEKSLMELSLDDDISSWSLRASSVAYFLIYSKKGV